MKLPTLWKHDPGPVILPGSRVEARVPYCHWKSFSGVLINSKTRLMGWQMSVLEMIWITRFILFLFSYENDMVLNEFPASI